jgi:TolB-like protein
MKRNGLFLAAVFVLITGLAHAQQAISLGDAIQNTATAVDGRLESGSKVVVLNFNAPTERFSNYVIEELTAALVNSGNLIMVDRQNLALIQQEMNFQQSGEVSDNSAQEIGRKLGAQSIVSGSIEDMGSTYRLRFRVIEVVSAAIQLAPSMNVRKDNQIAVLMSGTPASPNYGPAPSSISATTYPNGLNYSTGRKVGAGFLNWIVGVGSFTMGDWVGGLIVGGVEATGIVFTMVGMLNYKEEEGDRYDSASGDYSEGGPSPLLFVGIALQAVGVIYGHIRPFQYDKALAKKNGTYYASNNPMDHISLTMLPDEKGNIGGVSLSFSYQF